MTRSASQAGAHGAEASTAELPQRAVWAAADLDILKAKRHALQGRRLECNIQRGALRHAPPSSWAGASYNQAETPLVTQLTADELSAEGCR